MNILSQNAFWIVNKELSKKVGIEAALLLSDLITKAEYFQQKGQIDKEGYFFNTSEEIEADTTLSYHKQKKAIAKLEKEGFIETSLKGVPARLHFKISENKILNFLNHSFRIFQKLDLEKSENINKNKEIIINNKKEDTLFSDFLSNYGKLGATTKALTLRAFNKLTAAEKQEAITAAVAYNDYLKKASWRPKMNASTFLNKKYFETNWKELAKEERQEKATTPTPATFTTTKLSKEAQERLKNIEDRLEDLF